MSLTSIAQLQDCCGTNACDVLVQRMEWKENSCEIGCRRSGNGRRMCLCKWQSKDCGMAVGVDVQEDCGRKEKKTEAQIRHVIEGRR